MIFKGIWNVLFPFLSPWLHHPVYINKTETRKKVVNTAMDTWGRHCRVFCRPAHINKCSTVYIQSISWLCKWYLNLLYRCARNWCCISQKFIYFIFVCFCGVIFLCFALVTHLKFLETEILFSFSFDKIALLFFPLWMR